MGSGLQRRIKQAHFRSPQQEALLNLSVAAAYLREQSERVVEAFDITLPQYNVLRILRGIHPDGHPRGEIASRMLDRAPDVTRIVDRLSAKKLVERDRNGDDKRQSITRITRWARSTCAQLSAHSSPTRRPASVSVATIARRSGTFW